MVGGHADQFLERSRARRALAVRSVPGGDRDDRRAEVDRDAGGGDLVGEALGEFGAGEFLGKLVQAEAVVDALQQDPAELVFPFDYRAGETRGLDFQGRGHARGSRADNDGVVAEFLHNSPSSTRLEPPCLVTPSQESPVSRMMILMIL